MWIAKIELVNFKSYASQIFTFPEPRNGKNVVLVGGMNGFGKTSLLEALYLCMYGNEAMIWLGRAAKIGKDRSYSLFLERALYGKVDATNTMSVAVEVRENAETGFIVQRKWFFAGNGDYREEEPQISEIVAGSRRSVPKERLPEILADRFVSSYLAPFFFFDGEEIEKLADPSQVEQIKLNMESLLGVRLLRDLEQHLASYQSKQKSGMDVVDEEKYQTLVKKHEDEQQKHEDLKARYDRIKAELVILEDRRGKLTDLLTPSGGGGDVASAKEIVAQQERLKTQISECAKEMDELLADRLPFHFIDKNRLETLATQLRSEITRENWDAGRKVMAPQKNVFTRVFTDGALSKIDPPLDARQRADLLQILDDAWDGLFHPLPKDCAEKILHTHLTNNQRQNVCEFIDNLSLGAQHIRGVLNRETGFERQLRELEKQLIRIEGIDNDGTQKRRKEELQQVNKDISGRNIDEGDLKRQIQGLWSTLEQDKKTLAHMEEIRAKSVSPQSNIAKAQRVRELIKELLPELYRLKTGQLSEAVTEAYKSLAHKSQIDCIEIDETGASRFFAGNQPVPFDLSAGENQLFATALLAGMAQVSGVSAPLIVDTPLARLDSKHRRNLLDFWRHQPRQVILLAQDKEIDAEACSQLGDAIGKTWLLEYEGLSEGIGRTMAREDRYFARTI